MSSNTALDVAMYGDVEAYVYQDPSGSAPATESAKAPEGPRKPGPGLAQVNEQELARLLANARAEGVREGEQRYKAALEDALAEERKQISEVLSKFLQEQTNYYSKVEVELVHFALAIAARILHREAEVDRMVVAGLVKVMIDKLQQQSRVIVRVRPEEAASWRHYFRDNTSLQIVEDASLAARDCVLETELGTTEMGLDAQLKEIEKGFADLLAQRPEPR